ncbi:hypothetical protein SVIOM74S_10115 [Streptomyces violarus]
MLGAGRVVLAAGGVPGGAARRACRRRSCRRCAAGEGAGCGWRCPADAPLLTAGPGGGPRADRRFPGAPRRAASWSSAPPARAGLGRHGDRGRRVRLLRDAQARPGIPSCRSRRPGRGCVPAPRQRAAARPDQAGRACCWPPGTTATACCSRRSPATPWRIPSDTGGAPEERPPVHPRRFEAPSSRSSPHERLGQRRARRWRPASPWTPWCAVPEGPPEWPALVDVVAARAAGPRRSARASESSPPARRFTRRPTTPSSSVVRLSRPVLIWKHRGARLDVLERGWRRPGSSVGTVRHAVQRHRRSAARSSGPTRQPRLPGIRRATTAVAARHLRRPRDREGARIVTGYPAGQGQVAC